MEPDPNATEYLDFIGSKRRLQLLVDAVRDYAIYLLDAQGVVRSWKAGAEWFKGYKAEEMIGQHFSRFYTEEDRVNGLPERALRTAADEGKFEAEGWRVRKDGTRFWTNVLIDPVYSETGLSFQAPIAELGQDVDDQHPTRGLVVDDQHGLPSFRT